MSKAKILVIASSDFVITSKSVFWPDVTLLADTDLKRMKSTSMAIRVQRQTELNPITIVFAGVNDILHSRGLLSRLREPATAGGVVWPAIKDVLESIGEIMDVLKEGGFQKINPKPVFLLSTGYAHLADGMISVYAMIALLSERKTDVMIPAPDCKVETSGLRHLRSEMPQYGKIYQTPSED